MTIKKEGLHTSPLFLLSEYMLPEVTRRHDLLFKFCLEDFLQFFDFRLNHQTAVRLI